MGFKTHLNVGKQEAITQATRIGNEIGTIQGFCDFLIHQNNNIEKNPKPKVIQLSEKINLVVKDFPFDEPSDESFQKKIDLIRAYFRQIVALSRNTDVCVKMNEFLQACKNTGLKMKSG